MISTHVLDLNSGLPARGVGVLLERNSGKSWDRVSHSTTNIDGRVEFACERKEGEYRLTFEIEDYFKKTNFQAFFIVAPVTFRITDLNRKYHIPLLLSHYGFSTYRGS